MTPSLSALLKRGAVIPAHPLALDENRRFDEQRQVALTRYYIDAGAGGVAVGVHTTQFEIRESGVGLFEPVLRLASQTVDAYAGDRPVMKIAGICGKTDQAVSEAEFARGCGYHAGLLSVAALKEETIPELIDHCRKVAEVIPVFGFYLQPAVGGRLLPYPFWRDFASIENVIGIKMAPFNRYQTIDVIRGVCESDRADEIALYTGNDDNIVADLLTEYRIRVGDKEKRVRIVGGLLGHWACWTKGAVDLLDEAHALVDSGASIPPEWLTRNIDVTDANAAFFDVANGFAGC
ncbi:MAG: dihydrodipicolinate synthase family protein, partial [Planctomycetota bacterium]|nr:dihydrodipicolinate synthase family protein [Planctomycetota bacterium]